jgi:hypothetical protein
MQMGENNIVAMARKCTTFCYSKIIKLSNHIYGHR